jgi:SOS response regulatory protein OraA/RecX
MISYELKRKGINKEVVEQTLDSAQEDIKTAKEYIEKRLHQFQKLEPGNKTKRIIGRLQSRGYNWDIIKEVLKSIN